MNDHQLRQFEKAIRSACRHHLANGGTLISANYWTSETMVDPIRALVAPLPTRNPLVRLYLFILSLFGKTMPATLPAGAIVVSYPKTVSSILGFEVSARDVSSFTRGWDAQDVGFLEPSEGDSQRLFKLGEMLHEEFKPYYEPN